MIDTVSDQQRRLHRYELTAEVEVFDAHRGTRLGVLVNVHEEGLMLMGGSELAEDHVYQLRLKLPATSQLSADISIGVDCLWSRGGEGAHLKWYGCHIIDISDEARAQLKSLIDQFGK